MKGQPNVMRWLVVMICCAVGATSCVSGAETETVDPGPSAEATAEVSDSTATGATNPTAPAVATIDADPNVLVWVHDREPPDLHVDDPDNSTDVAGWLQQGLIEGLFGVDRTITHYPELLSGEPSVEQLNSGTIVIDYTLRSGLMWSDETPLTAEDVAYTHRIITEGCEVESDRSIVDSTNEGCELKMTSRFGYELVTDFEVTSPTSFTVTFAAFYPGWRNLYSRVFAAHAFGETARDVNDNLRRWSGQGGVLPSSGPLVFEQWAPGLAIDLIRNERYHGSASPDAGNDGPVSVDGVKLVFVGGRDARIDLLQRGEAHLMMSQADPAFAVLAENDQVVVAPSPGPVFEHWGLNLLNPHLAKPAVREALAYSIDKAALVSSLYAPIYGMETLAAEGVGNTYYMPTQDGYTDHQRQYAGGNARAAATALRSAGYTLGDDGVWTHPADGRLALRAGTTAGDELREQQMEVLQAQLAEAGIEILIDNGPGGLFFLEGPFSEQALEASASDGASGDGDLWDIAQFSWATSAWPGTVSGIYRSGSASNPYAFNNPAFDVAATDCDSTIDDEARSSCYNDLDRFVTTLDEGDDGLFIIPLSQRPRLFAYSVGALAEVGFAPDIRSGGPLVNLVDYRLNG